LGQLDLAAADYGEAIDVSRQVATPYRNRAVIFVKQGRLDNAIEDYTQAIRIDPTDVIAYDSRGSIYLKQGQAARAIADFDRVIHLIEQSSRRSGGGYHAGKKTAEVFAKRADAYRLNGEFQRAASDCQQALQIDPKCRLALAVRARLQAEDQGGPAPEDNP
jgi:tetratricopeptide (TPR) repeat protein